MGNINFIAWAAVASIQLLALNVCIHKINCLKAETLRLEDSDSKLTKRLVKIERDLSTHIDDLVRERLVSDWESDEEFDSR